MHAFFCDAFLSPVTKERFDIRIVWKQVSVMSDDQTLCSGSQGAVLNAFLDVISH